MLKGQLLENRAIVHITGADARKLLHGLVTCDVEHLAIGELAFGALLTPQGKILFDFFLQAIEEGFALDIAASSAEAFLKRLTLYRLRADVAFEIADEGGPVHGIWGDQDEAVDAALMRDPRHPGMGWRSYGGKVPSFKPGDYHAHRIAFGMPEGGLDFQFGDAFPHEALMDQFGGIDFKKGCYVGQEVVSRMQHRGTARSRFVIVDAEDALPIAGTVLTANGKAVGKMGSAIAKQGLALVRLDRAGEAMQAGQAVLAGETPVTLRLPGFVSFDWPEAVRS